MKVRAYSNLTRAELSKRGFRQAQNLTDSFLETEALSQRVIIGFDLDLGRFFREFEVERNLPLSPTFAQIVELLEPAFFTSAISRKDLRDGFYERRLAYCNYTPRSLSMAVAESLTDLLELVELMNAGRISPNVSHEHPQVETLPKEFRQVWREFWALVRRQLSEWRFKMDRYASTPK